MRQSERKICVTRICCAELRRTAAGSGGSLALLEPLQQYLLQDRDFGIFFSKPAPKRLSEFNGPKSWLQQLQFAPRYEKVLCRAGTTKQRSNTLFSLSGIALWIETQRQLFLPHRGAFMEMLKQRYGSRICSYVDDLAIAPSQGRPSTPSDCIRASALIEKLLLRCGPTRHPVKGIWGPRSQVIEHLGFRIDTVRGSFGVPAMNLNILEGTARRLLKMVR